MSLQEIEGLSKADLKNKLSQMGMSLDRDDHPREYYAQLYLEKSNAKNKITRDNTPFYNYNKTLRRKRERVKIKETDKELIDDPNYEEEEYEEEEEIFDEDEGEDFINKESEEKNEESEDKRKNSSKRKMRKKMKIDEKTNDYRESGIKIIRLIRKKKEKNQKNKNNLLKNDIQNSDVRRKILNNFNEMAGQSDDFANNNTENYIGGENTQNQNINKVQDSSTKNNEFYNVENKRNLPEIKSDVKNYEDNKDNNINQNLNEEIKQRNNIVSFGAPKDSINMNIYKLSNGPISFGVNPSSVITDNKKENISEYKNIKDNQNYSKPKTIILKWETPRQKEFLYSSMEKEEVNNLNKINPQSEFETKDDEKKIRNQQRGQIVSDSIHSTTISQNAKNNNNLKIIEDNNYKAKLRNYKGNNEIKINDSNNLNTNNENIYTKVIKDNNNLNEKEYIYMNNINDNDNNKDNKEFNINNKQENNNENMNIIDNNINIYRESNNNNNNYYYENNMEIKDNNNNIYLSKNDNNMNNINYCEKDVEMKDNIDMKNINDEKDYNELNNKEQVSEQEYQNTENKKTKNCLIF